MKNVLIAALAATLSFGASAVNLSTTITDTTTTSTATVNQKVTGTIEGLEVNYSQNRSFAEVGCGAECNGNDTNSVGISIDVTKTVTDLDQHTTGVRTSTAEACDVTISIGGLSNSQGSVVTTFDGTSLNTANNNVTTITTASVDAVTQTDSNYTGGHFNPSKVGNDFDLNIGNITVNSEGNHVDLVSVGNALLNADASSITMTGQDLKHADTNAISLNIEFGELKVVDTTSTNVTTTGTTTETYERN
ncbi:hypothetical protein [Vibrio phage VCPH]|nr:hypothetical protein [Vibrio phage VCPH]